MEAVLWFKHKLFVHVRKHALHPEPGMFQERFPFPQRQHRQLFFGTWNQVSYLFNQILLYSSSQHFPSTDFVLLSQALSFLAVTHRFLVGHKCRPCYQTSHRGLVNTTQ